MIDGSSSPHRVQEHRSSARWWAGTSRRVTDVGATAQLTAPRISGGGALRSSWWYLGAQQPKVHLLRSSNSIKSTISTMKMKTMRSTLAWATTRATSCTEMLTRGNPSVLKLRSPTACFVLCCYTWASPPPPNTGSRESCYNTPCYRNPN
jgi:hypothetical protein